LEVLPSLHPDRYFGYLWLQGAYSARYRVHRKSTDLSLTVENFRLASRHPTQGLPNRILRAWNWIVAAEQHSHSSALEAYTHFSNFLTVTWHHDRQQSHGVKLLLPSIMLDQRP
jgi:hypothetical protein